MNGGRFQFVRDQFARRSRAALCASILLGSACAGGCILVVGGSSRPTYESYSYAESSDWPSKRIGISLEAVGPALAAQAGVNPAECSLVTYVLAGSPAATAGVQRFDILTTVDGRPAGSIVALRSAVVSKDVGQTVNLRLVRAGQVIELNVPVERNHGHE